MRGLDTRHTATTARAEQLLYVGAVTPHDPESGAVATTLADVPAEAKEALSGKLLVDIQSEAAIVQAWMVYSTLSRILEAEETSLARLLRQRLFLKDLRDLPAVERVMQLFLGDDKPATSVVQIPGYGVDDRMVLQLDAVALLPAGELSREVITLPSFAAATGGYPQATRAGQFVFVSGTHGVNPDTGKIGTSLDELGSDADRFAEHRFRSAWEEAVCVQSWFTFKTIAATLESQGASLADILKVNGWLVFDMRGYEHHSLAREALFGDAGSVPASSALSISGLPQDGAHLAFEAVALVPEEGGYRKDLKLPIHPIVSTYVGAVAGGPLVLTCGEVPIDVSGPVPRSITKFVDLDPPGRLLAFGRINAPADFEARAWFVYQQHKSYLELYGASFADVVHQTVYLCDPREYPAVERIASLFFGARVPPTTLIPITDTSPYREALLEIELVAARKT